MGRMSGQSVFDTKLEKYSRTPTRNRGECLHTFALKRAALSKMDTKLVVSQLRLQKKSVKYFHTRGATLCTHGRTRDDVHSLF